MKYLNLLSSFNDFGVLTSTAGITPITECNVHSNLSTVYFFISNFWNSNRSLEEDKKYATYRSYGALLFSVPSLYKHFTTVKASP